MTVTAKRQRSPGGDAHASASSATAMATAAMKISACIVDSIQMVRRRCVPTGI
jgi:hypothetical protein